MRYEWDTAKARSNLRKHGVAFAEALTVFLDPSALTLNDPEHSADEQRFITIGVSQRGRVLMVAHADRGDDRLRIISARRATRRERHVYEER